MKKRDVQSSGFTILVLTFTQWFIFSTKLNLVLSHLLISFPITCGTKILILKRGEGCGRL